MRLSRIKGMKYPDDFFIKFFFKNGFDAKEKLKFLEFGCGNGNNLMLPVEYGHEVIGVDYNQNLVDLAKENFGKFYSDKTYSFFCDDMRKFACDHENVNANIFSLPNIVNYLHKKDFIEFLSNSKSRKLFCKGASIFIRWRSPRDFRNGFGQRISKNCYQVDSENDMTGESGALNTFYTEVEMLDLLREYLSLTNFHLFHVDFENITNRGDVIFNSDIVVWGDIF